ncbi:MAG TPA: metallophosphoesterase, partial [Solirubrobacteraceae bacterium]|nr:metallophosphoesterase [Solirubrobacteraceae bacterium]
MSRRPRHLAPRHLAHPPWEFRQGRADRDTSAAAEVTALTRRGLLGASAALAGAALLAGCGGSAGPPAAGDGSTLRSTYVDPQGTGVLSVGPGEPLLARTVLAPAAPATGTLATLAHLTDAHVLDAQSPARVPFLDRLGAPFTSTFRPQEALTAQVLAGAIAAVDALGPDLVVQGGDLIDNAQANELTQALAVLRGGRVGPSSGDGRYVGVQEASDPDPFYYRPDVDSPRHPGLLAAAQRVFASRGLEAMTLPVLGDHDLLVAGVLAPDALTEQIAVGSRAVWDLPRGLPTRLSATAAGPDGLNDPAAIEGLITVLLSAPGVTVPAYASRRELDAAEVLSMLRPGSGPLLDYALDVGDALRVIVLDLVRRGGGSGGLVHPGQPAWLAAQLAGAGDRWVLVFSHQPLDSSADGPALLSVLDRSPRVLAAV